MLKNILLLVLLISTTSLFAQKKPKEYTTQNTKAIEAYEKGISNLRSADIKAGIKQMQNAIKQEPLFVEPHLVLADVYLDISDTVNALLYYTKTTQINPAFYPVVWFNKGELELELKRYQEAMNSFIELRKYDVGKDISLKAEKYIKQIDFRVTCLEKPVPFLPQNLGNNINTADDEYLPSLTADEQTLIFTRRFPRDDNTTANTLEEEDFYASQKINGEWAKAVRLPEPVNTTGNEGAQAISPDGRYLFFTACNRKNGYGSCDLYVSELLGGTTWSQPKNLGANINSKYWESQPSISPDGRTLYFTSNRPGGKGASDIWKSILDENGVWGKPINLGDSINTEGHEVSPFIHPDNQTLYFSSDGHIGMGKKDIFYSRRKNDTAWSTPINLGCPINTEGDEVNLTVSASGIKALFSSDKLQGFGKQDVFEFELYKEARPIIVTYLKGRVFDAVTTKNLQADFEIINIETGEIVTRSKSDAKTGRFLVSLPTNQNYALNVSAENYLFHSENFSVSKDNVKPYLKDIALKPIMVGESMVLKNIFFETNKWELKSESKVELDKLVLFLKKNKTIFVEISGHTDNMGSPKSNLLLSENRAKSVCDYLVENQINPQRITSKGMGETVPIDNNQTEQGRANNRRTEFKILRK